MFKVFIAEDESIVREGLRDSIPWADCGFEFAGDAMDGETALPMILDIKPDLLITDIKMPFMDGLELSSRVKEALPSTKIVILSGYDEFDFARRAIALKVDEYLLKPIRKDEMVSTLSDIRQRIEEDRQLQDYISLYATDAREYEQYSRRVLFESLISGKADEHETYSRAEELGINLNSECFNTVMFMIESGDSGFSYSDVSVVQDEVIEKILMNDNYVLFRSSMLSYCIIIKCTTENAEADTLECIDIISSVCTASPMPFSWYVSSGVPVTSLSMLSSSYAEASRMIAYRHFAPDVNVLCRSNLPDIVSENIGIESYNADPMVIRSFIKTGFSSEADAFVSDFLENIGDAEQSALFRNYLVISVRINSAIVVQELGASREDFIASLPPVPMDTDNFSLSEYISQTLKSAISFRDSLAQSRSGDVVNMALEYIDSHYTDEDISLNTVAKAINISSNYLSASFSQKTGISFVEYITDKRMEKAKELLTQTSMRSGEIGAEVGFHDPRYFSFVFRKSVGCTPKEYRSGGTDK